MLGRSGRCREVVSDDVGRRSPRRGGGGRSSSGSTSRRAIAAVGDRGSGDRPRRGDVPCRGRVGRSLSPDAGRSASRGWRRGRRAQPAAVKEARAQQLLRRLKSDERDLGGMAELMIRGAGRLPQIRDDAMAAQSAWTAHRRRKVAAHVALSSFARPSSSSAAASQATTTTSPPTGDDCAATASDPRSPPSRSGTEPTGSRSRCSAPSEPLTSRTVATRR